MLNVITKYLFEEVFDNSTPVTIYGNHQLIFKGFIWMLFEEKEYEKLKYNILNSEVTFISNKDNMLLIYLK